MKYPVVWRPWGAALALSLIIPTAAAGTVIAAPANDTSLGLALPGGTFEDSAQPSLPAGWTGAGPGKASTDAASARTGVSGARITSVSETEATTLTSPQVKLEKSTNVIYYRGLVRPQEGSPKVELRVRFTAANGTEVGQESAAAVGLKAGLWSEVSLTAATPANAKHVQVSVHVLGAGSVDVDDVAPDVRQQRQLVPNGGAESAATPPENDLEGWTPASVQ